jgi:hypothetical protein
MLYPNSALAAWQLALIAVVAVGTLAAWLAAVFLAARPPRRADGAALASPGESAAGTRQPAVAAEPEPAKQAEGRKAA